MLVRCIALVVLSSSAEVSVGEGLLRGHDGESLRFADAIRL